MAETAFLSIRNHALVGKALPDTLTFLRFGDNPTDRGVFKVTERSVQAIQSQRNGGVLDRVIVDFEHNSVASSPTYQPPPRHHAAAGMVFCSKERGLGMESLEWTPKGEEFARNYPDVSPAVQYDKDTLEVVGLLSAGLVPNSGIIGLSFFSALEPIEVPPGGENPNKEQDNMDLEAEVKALVASVKALEERLAKLEPSVQPVEAMSAKTKELETRIASAQADFQAELARRDKAALLQSAAFAGKVVSLTDTAIAAMSATDLKAHIDAIKSTVPLHLRTPLGAKPEQGDGLTLLEQFNAIEDPQKKATFFTENRAKLTGAR